MVQRKIYGAREGTSEPEEELWGQMINYGARC